MSFDYFHSANVVKTRSMKAELAAVNRHANERSTAQGLSMRPPSLEETALTPYQPAAAAKLLADPCMNCQKMISQMLGHENVLSQFGVGELKRRAGVVKEREGFTGTKVDARTGQKV